MDLKELTSAEAVFEELGGIQAVADLTGSGYRAVFNWKAADAFPAKTYVTVIDALREHGCCAPASLFGMVPSATEAAE